MRKLASKRLKNLTYGLNSYSFTCPPFNVIPNPQSPQQFNAFVKRIETNASQHPRYYRFRLRLLAILGYIYIIAVFAALCALLWGLRSALTHNSGGSVSIDPIIFLLGFGVIRLFLTHIPAPEGVPVTRSQAPELFKVIDQFSQALNAPPFHHIFLTSKLNAAVAQRPRFGIMGWSQNYLLLGLPLMHVLTPEQFQAVLVHELGHLAGNDSRFSSWIYQVRRIWFDLAEQFELSHQGGWLFRRFFQWYGPFFNAYSFVLARAHEYEADRAAVQWVGVIPKAEALLQLRIYSHFLHGTIWPQVYKQTLSVTTPPDNTITHIVNALKRGPSRQDARSTIELALMAATSTDDTHPCLGDRLQALGYDVDLDNLPPIPTHTAAQALLGLNMEQWLDQLDLAWAETHQKEWEHYALIQHQKHQCLEYLEQKVNAQSPAVLSVEEAWQRAFLTGQFHGPKPALPLFRAVLKKAPHHPHANYHLGKLLVEQEDWSGIAYLERAMEIHPALVIPGTELLYEVYQSRQQFSKAVSYRQRRQHHQALWSTAKYERTTLNAGDRFFYHDLPLAECQQLAASLARCDQVQMAYLVQKTISSSSGLLKAPSTSHSNVPPSIQPSELSPESLSEPPIYVLGIVRQLIAGRGADTLDNATFATWLHAGLCFSADLKVVIFTRPSMPLCRAIQTVKRSRLYIKPRRS